MIKLYIFVRYAIYGDLRNWNKKQQVPGRRLRKFTDARAAGNFLDMEKE